MRVIKRIKWIIRRALGKLEFLGNKILDQEESQERIIDLLTSKEPSMICRLGAVEARCLYEYEKGKKFSENTIISMSRNAGFFPSDESNLKRVSELYFDCLREVDHVGVMFNLGEGRILKKNSLSTSYSERGGIDPFYTLNNWTKVLKGKKVLVVHPFKDTIESQWRNKEKLFSDNEISLDFDLEVIKSVQSIGGNTEYKDWFEAYETMCNEIEKKEFDIAIIGAGAYGLPLAAFVKRIGKKSIHLGGTTQLLFGIKGGRWDNERGLKNYYNQWWVRPLESEKPSSYKKVEGGCYW